MGIKSTTTGMMFSEVFDLQAMQNFSKEVLQQIVARTFDKGIGADGKPLAQYSAKPIRIYFRSRTGRALTPKGGTPFQYSRGPHKGQAAGVFYAGGYRAYKQASNGGKKLILSGHLSKSLRIVRVSRYAFQIGFSGEAEKYGPFAESKRPIFGLTGADIKALEAALARETEAAMARSAGKGGKK